MSRYIDADSLLMDIIHNMDYCEDILEFIEAQPTADVVEVVRCKDCEYGEQDEIGRWFCRNFGCQVGDENGNGFCADGERKETEDE